MMIENVEPLRQGIEPLSAPHRDAPLSFTVLFPNQLQVDPQRLALDLRGFHPRMEDAQVFFQNRTAANAPLFVRASWRKHVIEIKSFAEKMQDEDLEPCLQPCIGSPSYKNALRAHQSHAELSYIGGSTSTLNQYVALGALACCLYKQGAIAIVNKLAHTILQADALALGVAEGDCLKLLGTLPLGLLYCGFVKYEIENEPGVWMRTYGAHAFGLPDFAVHAKSHNDGEFFFGLFESIWKYLNESGAKLAVDQTMECGGFLATFRAPPVEDYFLDSPGQLLVLELNSPIGKKLRRFFQW